MRKTKNETIINNIKFIGNTQEICKIRYKYISKYSKYEFSLYLMVDNQRLYVKKFELISE